jgi:hypothetical protein
VARAITAAPRYFKAMEIENKVFVDGALGYNNPTWLGHREVEQNHEQDVGDAGGRHYENIISIGTGRARPARLVGPPGIGRYLNFLRHTTKLVSDPDNINYLLDVLSGMPHVFYKRFNVPQGLGHISLDEFRTCKSRDRPNEIAFLTLDDIREKTTTYLERHESRTDVRETAQRIFDAVQARRCPDYPNRFPFPPPQPRDNGSSSASSPGSSSPMAVEATHEPN